MARVFRFNPGLIRTARDEAGLTAEDVAAALECSWRTILNYENGRTPMPAERLGIFAALVNMNPADFYVWSRMRA